MSSDTKIDGCAAVNHVDPFLGVESRRLPEPEGIVKKWWCPKPPIGNTHPGACLPFGMVSVCAYGGGYISGYGAYGLSLDGNAPEPVLTPGKARGFTHFHQTGTGRIRVYYNYLRVVPCQNGLSEIQEDFSLAEESAEPGRYAVAIPERGVKASVTVGEKKAIHHYEYEDVTDESLIAVDVSTGGLLIEDMKTVPTAAKMSVVSRNEVEGFVVMEGIPIHFVVRATGSSGRPRLWSDGSDLEKDHFRLHASKGGPRPFGFAFQVGEAGKVSLQIGFSIRSIQQAREALGDETDLQALASVARKRWSEFLGKIEVRGGDPKRHEIFYSALYHSLLKPSNFTGENPFEEGDGPFFVDFSTLWDAYKTQLPLVMTFYPEVGRNIVNALLAISKREGNFPISYLLDNAPDRFGKQGSCLAHVPIMDAFVRGIEGINWDEALDLMHAGLKKGNGVEFGKKGSVHPLSHSLDLAYANFLTAQLAQALGNYRMGRKLMGYAGFWRNAFDPSSGRLRESTYYEGELWNYSFRFVQNMAGRVQIAGGKKNFVHDLDLFFGFSDPPEGFEMTRFEGLNNEPDMEAPYAYVYAGRHDRTAVVVDSARRYSFANGRGGLPGNDDSGGISSWYVWSSLGIFPVAGQGIYLIGTPEFPESKLHLPEGVLTIVAKNWAEKGKPYVTGAKLNGKMLNRAWFKHTEINQGGELVLEMSETPNGWDEVPPPSFPSYDESMDL